MRCLDKFSKSTSRYQRERERVSVGWSGISNSIESVRTIVFPEMEREPNLLSRGGGGGGRYQGEGTNRRLELSDTRYCETSPLMARPETALQDEREHEPENRWGLSTFASSRELAQLATRFRYLLRDLAIRNLDNRPIFNVSTCVCIFDVKQGSRGEIFRKLYFLSFLCTFHSSTKLQLITNILPRIDTSYCYDL